MPSNLKINHNNPSVEGANGGQKTLLIYYIYLREGYMCMDKNVFFSPYKINLHIVKFLRIVDRRSLKKWERKKRRVR